jgi:hypothetical protein
MGKTMSVRMDDRNYEFIRRLARDEKADLSEAVRELGERAMTQTRRPCFHIQVTPFSISQCPDRQ